MPTETSAARPAAAPRRWWPEALLAVLTGAVLLGFLGSVELWGKREQRASAEAIDTIDHNHWLVAQIQGRPRLEKPPLPRWSISALMLLTGRRNEWMVRLPGALAGVATVALIYALGKFMGGRPLALAASFILCTMGFFVGEMRQAGNDAPLALFTCLALYAAFRRFHEDDDASPVDDLATASKEHRTLQGSTFWSVLFHAALGLGFLTKGPVILLLVGVTIIPYLAFSRRITCGLGRLCNAWGLLIFAAMALSWPVAVLLADPGALRVWTIEISEKAGFTRILEHRRHIPLLAEWPGMVLPWTLVAAVAVLLPFWSAPVRSSRDQTAKLGPRFLGTRDPSTIWFAWWWAVGNLFVMCCWSVAKPNYYVPCLPGMALLVAATWLHLARVGRGQCKWALFARGILQTQWVLMIVAAAVAPLVVRPWIPAAIWPWSIVIALAIAASVALSVHAWRRGADELPLAPVAAACVMGILIAYGMIAPVENDRRSHRVLANKLLEVVPSGARTLKFFNEIDEGLWFYLDGLDLSPVPGTHPRYNTSYDLAHSYLTERLPSETISQLEAKRQARDKQALIDWLDHGDSRRSYLLIRGSLYDGFARDLADRAVPVFRETGMKRNELVLLQVSDRRPVSTTAAAALTPRR
jgi:4-amino-4-deoxy-L-arabinose transferase-like glycosyltransferase